MPEELAQVVFGRGAPSYPVLGRSSADQAGDSHLANRSLSPNEHGPDLRSVSDTQFVPKLGEHPPEPLHCPLPPLRYAAARSPGLCIETGNLLIAGMRITTNE